jgi:hypothetical protein
VPSTASDNDQENLAKRMIQNILFVKHPTENRFDPLIVRYYPDEETSKRDFNEINYQMIDEKWSGWIDLFSYDEHYLVGFQVEKGQITESRTFKKSSLNGKVGIGFENKDVRCKIMETVWINVSIAGSTITVTSLETTYSQSCSMGGLDSSTLNSGTASNYYGDGYTPWGGGSLDSYSVPDVPLPKLTIYIDISISSDPRLSCIVDKLSMSEFAKKIAEFTKTDNLSKNAILKIGETVGNANGQVQKINGIYHITIGKSQLDRPSLLIIRTILHEMVHAEIYAALESNKQTVLDNNFISNYNQLIGLYASKEPEKWAGEQQHKYMADYLLFEMGTALMNYHKTFMLDDFQKLTKEMNYAGGYPKGIPVDYYINQFWKGFEGTHAFDIMSSITTNSPLLSPRQKYERDVLSLQLLTKECGN